MKTEGAFLVHGAKGMTERGQPPQIPYDFFPGRATQPRPSKPVQRNSIPGDFSKSSGELNICPTCGDYWGANEDLNTHFW